MKPSEALAKGREVIKIQTSHNFFDRTSGGKLCACALGMMAVGAGYPPPDPDTYRPSDGIGVRAFLEDQLPVLFTPDKDGSDWDYKVVILNDSAHKTARQIQLVLERAGL